MLSFIKQMIKHIFSESPSPEPSPEPEPRQTINLEDYCYNNGDSLFYKMTGEEYDNYMHGLQPPKNHQGDGYLIIHNHPEIRNDRRLQKWFPKWMGDGMIEAYKRPLTFHSGMNFKSSGCNPSLTSIPN